MSILCKYFTPAGHLSVNTQAGYVVALKFGIYRDKETTIDTLQPINVLYERGFMGITKEMVGEAIEKIKMLKY